MSKRVTIGSIAREVGLSKFAVSRALAGKSGVSDATRARVAEAAAIAGYRRSSASGSPEIGVIFDETDIANSELQVQVQNGVRRETQRLGIDARFHWVRNSAELEPAALGHDGLIVVGPAAARGFRQVHGNGIPVVRVGWAAPLEPVDTVDSTNREAGEAAIAFLAALGHRVIAYVHGVPGYRGRLERLRGARDAAESLDGVRLRNMTWAEHGSFAAAMTRLRASGYHPTAYFCGNDGLAVTTITELLASGQRIPDDASVVGFGDYASARQVSPQLTTIRVKGTAIGEVAVRLLRDRMAATDARTQPIRVQIPMELIERASTGPPPKLGP